MDVRLVTKAERAGRWDSKLVIKRITDKIRRLKTHINELKMGGNYVKNTNDYAKRSNHIIHRCDGSVYLLPFTELGDNSDELFDIYGRDTNYNSDPGRDAYRIFWRLSFCSEAAIHKTHPFQS